MPIFNSVFKSFQRWGKWDATGATSTSSIWVANTCRWAFMSDDGYHFYTGLESGRAVVQYDLSTPYKLSTASQVYSLSTDAQNQIWFDETWTYLYTAGVKQYTLSTPRQLSTATQTWTLAVNFPQWWCRLCQVIDDTHLWLAWSYNWAWNQCMVTLSAPHDLSNVTRVYTTRSSTDRMVRNHDGTIILFSGYWSSVALQQATCSTPFDISTMWTATNILTWKKYPYYAYTNRNCWLIFWDENNTVYYYNLPNS